jgi:ribosomal protein S3
MLKTSLLIAAAVGVAHVGILANGSSAPSAPSGGGMSGMATMTPEERAIAAYRSGDEHRVKGKKFEEEAGTKKGADIEKLKSDLGRFTDSEIHLNIVEIRKPEIDAKLVADNIAQQLERRVAFRRAMKRSVQSAMRLGAQGIRINCTGRLGGAEIARVEWYREGRVPLHTLRADVDYGVATAKTTYGTCGVKVWIFKGEIMEHDPMAQDKRLDAAAEAASRGGAAGGRPDRERAGA